MGQNNTAVILRGITWWVLPASGTPVGGFASCAAAEHHARMSGYEIEGAAQ